MGLDITAILPDLRVSLLLAAVPVAGVLKAWFGYRRAVMVEQWRTARLRSALRSVGPEHRAEVIAACASVEAACAATPEARPQPVAGQ